MVLVRDLSRAIRLRIPDADLANACGQPNYPFLSFARMTQECGVSTGNEPEMNKSSSCLFPAMLPPPSIRQIPMARKGHEP